jgi:hypothetical protein
MLMTMCIPHRPRRVSGRRAGWPRADVRNESGADCPISLRRDAAPVNDGGGRERRRSGRAGGAALRQPVGSLKRRTRDSSASCADPVVGARGAAWCPLLPTSEAESETPPRRASQRPENGSSMKRGLPVPDAQQDLSTSSSAYGCGRSITAIAKKVNRRNGSARSGRSGIRRRR